MTEDLRPPFRQQFDNARDPYTARNALGITSTGGGGSGFITAVTPPLQVTGTTLSIDLSAYLTTANAAATYQPLDADLTALAALTGTNTIYYRSAANTWSPVTVSTGLSFTGGTLTCTVSTAGFQPLDATLTALAAYNTNGLLTQTAADTFTGRTLTGAAAGITVSNGNGVAGNPTLALADDLAALEALTGTSTIYYRSGTSAWTAVTIGTGLTFTSGTLAATGGGGTATPGPPQGRLTLQTATPVMITTQSAKTTIYFTPYVGDQIPLYSGSAMVMTTFTELSVATTDTTKSPAAIGASKINDWYVWNDAGTIRLGHGPDWTSDTTRGASLTPMQGILTNSFAITNGPAAQRGTYVGTTRSNASSQLDWIIGGSAAGGTAAFLGVWNAYNRVRYAVQVFETTASWTYNSTTWRVPRGSTTNFVGFVRGLQEDSVLASYTVTGTGGASGDVEIGIGLDGIVPVVASHGSFGTFSAPFSSVYHGMPPIGFHFLQPLERQVTTASGATFFAILGAIQVENFQTTLTI